MTAPRQALFWIGVAAVFVAILALLSDIMLPFVAGLAVAYFLDPLADRVERRGAPRALAATLVLAVFFLAFVAVLLLIVPMLEAQLLSLLGQLPEIGAHVRGVLAGLLAKLSARVSPEHIEQARQAAADLPQRLVSWILSLIDDAWRSGVALLNLIGLLVVTPVVSWYLLRDWDRLIAQVDGWLPRAHRAVIREQCGLIDDTLAGFVRGQATVCLILGGAYALALELAGLQYGLVVGLISGLISFIPYVGSLVGLALSLGLAVIQFDEPLRIVLIAVIFVAGQAIEGNFLTPKLVGERVGLHAVWVLFAMLAGGSLFGFVGVLLAVPVAAVIGVLVRFGLAHYLESEIYRGGAGGPDDRE
ncbi:MAG: AI-2E family transporter [Alphaproteobacteria bacterium]|nr:AI-2E family transporter [Alphaproteobacteria bacterium]MDP6517137.1 AI-2E family transporter [Alphaproteobacteria bacterium]